MRTTLIRSALAAATMSMWTGGALAAPLFTDSFENPMNSQAWQVYETFDSWSTTSGQGIEIQTQDAIGVAPFDGNQYVELDSDTDRLDGNPTSPGTNSAMTTRLTLSAGTYEVAFYYLPRTGNAGDNIIEVFLDGASETLQSNMIGSVDGVQSDFMTWERRSFLFDVDGNDNMYGLTFAAGGTANELGGFVDAVSVERIPLPASIGLLGAGLIGLGLLARREHREGAITARPNALLRRIRIATRDPLGPSAS